MVNGSVSLINGHIDEVNDEAGNQGGEDNVDGQRDITNGLVRSVIKEILCFLKMKIWKR